MGRKILIALFILFLVGAMIAGYGHKVIFSPNTAFSTKTATLKIAPNSSYQAVYDSLLASQMLKNIANFDKVAGWMKYKKDKVKSGKYILQKGWNNRQIVGHLRAGLQTPVDLTFNNMRNMEALAGALSKNIALDSIDVLDYFTNPSTLQKLQLTRENVMSLFIPNTYKVYWDISLEDLENRIKKEHDNFWSKDNRIEKARRLDMTPDQVYTLASIVEKESQHGPERPTIAGLYLNRIRKGIFLQADPTVVFATGEYDLRRVLNKHLAVDSPYNTYKYPGLPPGPIYMPSIQSIDAVLNAENHNYLYMCAKPGFGTKHAFAKTLRGHNENANKYRKWLSSQGIR